MFVCIFLKPIKRKCVRIKIYFVESVYVEVDFSLLYESIDVESLS